MLKFLSMFFYTAYADDLTFFLKGLSSFKKLLAVFSYYLKYSSLKLNFSKCEIAGLSPWKE